MGFQASPSRNHTNMNRNHFKVLGATTFLGLAALGHAQTGWVGFCDDPSTTTPLYSVDYQGNAIGNDLFGAALPTLGTVIYEICYPNPFTANAAGGLSFFTGGRASVQSSTDENLDLNFGGAFYSGVDNTGTPFFAPGGAAANWTYACVVRGKEGEQPKKTRIGTSGVTTYYFGASDRYMVAKWTEDSTFVEWRVDVLADAARVQWTMTNTAADAANVGLWFGQYVDPIHNYSLNPTGMDFINVPGQKPLSIHRRFQSVPDLAANDPREFAMPPYVDFAASQAQAWEGLRIINTPSDSEDGAFPDQTQVNGLDIGLAHFLLGDQPGNTGTFPDVLNEDVDILGESAYIQKWDQLNLEGTSEPTTSLRTRQIVSYYKTTWGDSNFSKPYNVAVDSPKVIGVQDSNPFNFVRSPSTLRVYIDNTRGFTTVDEAVQLENVSVILALPQGMGAAGNVKQNIITKSIGRVDPKQIKFVDFNIEAAPTTFGVKEFTVTIRPQPGPEKTVAGSITVASQPFLQLSKSANLVAAPWVFANSTWDGILGKGSDPLKPDIDYQAFAWDAATQQYVISTGPQRGLGQWIVMQKDVGFKQLAGGPATPTDLSIGAPLIDLKSGWNLVSNPYNYPIPIGQLVGVPGSDNRNAYTYAELTQRGTISGGFAYWDVGTQSYHFIDSAQDMLQPNTGYWVNVLDPLGLTVSYPAVYTPFIPAGTGGINSFPMSKQAPVPVKDHEAVWSINLIARQGGKLDDSNVFGLASPGTNVVRTRVYEPPISPEKDSISGAFEQTTKKGTIRLAKNLLGADDLRNYNFGLYTKKAGKVTVTWPQITQVSSKYQFTLRDAVTGAKVDMRAANSYSYVASDRTNRNLKISVTVQAAPLLDSVNVTKTATNAAINYTVSSDVTTTVKIMQDGKLIKTIVNGANQSEGAQSTIWNLKVANKKVASGWYKAEVTVSNGSKTEVQTAKFKVD